MKTNLNINIAKDEYGKDLIINIGTMKHLLIAGATGSGKSTLLHNIVSTLITNNFPHDMKLILVDSKRIELNAYTNIPHLLTPVIFDPKKAILAMKWAGKEIDRRFETLKRNDCKDIDTYHKTIVAPAIEKLREGIRPSDEEGFTLPETMPRLVIVVDEYSDFTQIYPREIEAVALKIAQVGHSVGVHIILSTSRAGTKIFTKALQDAVSTRIALQTISVSDSKLVIGTGDAHTLRGSGDMLYREGMKYVSRGQVNMFTYEEAKSIANSVNEKYKDEIADSVNLTSSTASASAAFDAMNDNDSLEDDDDMYEPAKEIVIKRKRASTSLIQRALGIGYSRAAKLMDALEEQGVIGPANGSEPRKVIAE